MSCGQHIVHLLTIRGQLQMPNDDVDDDDDNDGIHSDPDDPAPCVLRECVQYVRHVLV